MRLRESDGNIEEIDADKPFGASPVKQEVVVGHVSEARRRHNTLNTQSPVSRTGQCSLPCFAKMCPHSGHRSNSRMPMSKYPHVQQRVMSSPRRFRRFLTNKHIMITEENTAIFEPSPLQIGRNGMTGSPSSARWSTFHVPIHPPVKFVTVTELPSMRGMLYVRPTTILNGQPRASSVTHPFGGSKPCGVCEHSLHIGTLCGSDKAPVTGSSLPSITSPPSQCSCSTCHENPVGPFAS